MSESVICKKCGATSYNDPGHTALYCHGCYSAARAEADALRGERNTLRARIEKIERDGFHNCAARGGKPTDYDVTLCSVCSGRCYDSCSRLKEAEAEATTLRQQRAEMRAVFTSLRQENAALRARVEALEEERATLGEMLIAAQEAQS